MHALKLIAHDAIPHALTKAERYRLLNEPREAESICRDVLAIDPNNQAAITCLILAMTDLFAGLEVRADDARPLLRALSNPFDRAYYGGMVEERWAKALHAAGYPVHTVQTLIYAAMGLFEEADRLAPAGNDDAVLRWNACVRLIDRAGLAESPAEPGGEESLDDDVPVR